jgi:hypothetical protein
MSILKNNRRLSGSSVQSGARSTNSKVIPRVCATFLAGLILFLFAGSAKAAAPYNVLVNPGAEMGNLTGWNASLTGYIYVVSTNGTMAGVTNGTISTNQFLAHSGEWTFQLFDTDATSASIYQDYAAIAGSQWSASCWAICYASNYFDSALAYMSVAFYDTNNNVLGASFDPNFSQYGFGVYASAVLDPKPGNSVPGLIIVPTPATGPSGWLYLPATNFWFSYTPVNTNNAPGGNIETCLQLPIPVSTTLTAPPGTAFVRYQLEFDNPGTDGGDVYWDDCQLNKLNWSDPDITNAPSSMTVSLAASASFAVVATHTGAYPNEKLTYQWQKNGTNLPSGVGINDIAGSTTTATLSFTNLQGADSGLFDVVVTLKSAGYYTNTIRSVPVTLTVLVLSPLQKANVLGPNAGFENDPAWSPWEIFNGCAFAGAASVNVYDGNEVCLVGANSDRDNGFHHAFGTGANCTVVASVTPGSIWKAGGWAYIPSTNDYTDGNTCRLQIWFKDATGAAVPGTPTYESFKIYGLAYTNANMQYYPADTNDYGVGPTYHVQMARDQWCYLTVSNVVNNSGIGLEDDIPYNTLPGGVFMVPTNTTPATAQINFQVYEYCPQTTDIDPATGQPLPYLGNGTDAVYWDDMELIQIVPVTNLTTSVSGNNINLSFSAGAGLNYSVLYKTNLTDATWSVLTNVIAPMSWQTNVNSVGTSYPVTASDPLTAHSRFYRVLVQ